MNIDLSSKVAIVTGAAGGIGREIAITLGKERVKTVIIDICPKLLDEVKEEFKANGLEGRQYLCDVCDSENIKETVNRVAEEYGRIDILVNNAGVVASGTVETLPEKTWDNVMDVNLKGIFLMCKHVVPIMKKQRSGRILNAASFGAIIPRANGGAYAASKAGVVFFTRALAGEVGPWNITVNCYAPGMVSTEMTHYAERSPEEQRRLLDTLTIRRWGKKSEIADLVCFLASDMAEYITGTLIDVSGGKLATQMPREAYDIAHQEGLTDLGLLFSDR